MYVATAEKVKSLLLDYPEGRSAYIDGLHDGISVMARELCGIFFADNDRFNSHTFLVACGLREEVEN